MKVWVLENGIDYEGKATMGVYSTIEKAREAAITVISAENSWDSLYVTEVELDGEPDSNPGACWMTDGNQPVEWKRWT